MHIDNFTTEKQSLSIRLSWEIITAESETYVAVYLRLDCLYHIGWEIVLKRTLQLSELTLVPHVELRHRLENKYQLKHTEETPLSIYT